MISERDRTEKKRLNSSMVVLSPYDKILIAVEANPQARAMTSDDVAVNIILPIDLKAWLSFIFFL